MQDSPQEEKKNSKQWMKVGGTKGNITGNTGETQQHDNGRFTIRQSLNFEVQHNSPEVGLAKYELPKMRHSSVFLQLEQMCTW